MGDVSHLKNIISDSDVYNLLDEFNAEPIDMGDFIQSLTICHGGDSRKLYYYKENKKFVCYTHDGTFDIIGFIKNIKDTDFNGAIKYLTQRFVKSNFIIGEFLDDSDNDHTLNPTTTIHPKEKKTENLKIYDDHVLKYFYDYPHSEWINEGISVGTMKKYEISYNLDSNQIIIPHRDIKGNLVGIRCRNLNQELVDKGMKYVPIYYNGINYKYPTGMNLYGIYQNYDTIKKSRQIVLFEAEKSVMKMDSMYGVGNSVALNGTMLSDYQISLIDSIGVDEVVIAVDKEFDNYHSFEAKNYARKIYSIFKRLKSKYRVSIIWDMNGLLDRKDSPVDKSKEVFERLIKERIII